MMNKNSLKFVLWKYFLFFTLIILGTLWIFQVLFLNQYYKFIKTNDIKSVASTIEKNENSKNLETIINNAAFDKAVCIEVVDKDSTTLYTSEFMGRGCLTGKEQDTNYKTSFIQSGEKDTTYELINPRFSNQTLVYAIKLSGNKYAFVNTSIEPVDQTVSILANQLIIVTIIALILGFVVAYFISRHISNPIVKITNSAKKLAKGDFNTVFEIDENIAELNELADTLNYARDELSKTEELERDLMANVSHDLKTPLTMIKAYAEMSRDLHANNKEKRTENMNIIIEETDRLTVLVNDILDLSSMQSNIAELEQTDFDLAGLIKEIIKRYSIFKETEDYKFVYNGPEKLVIHADKKKMEQVIYNLVNNAINYTGDDNLVTINLIKTKGLIRVEIKDTGKGIDPKDIPYIWDKYYKNKKKHKRNLVGTGLGLAIVKNALEEHHFKYGVNSTLNKGSTFYFEIPKDEL
jgi:signal transduction histidine kinase